MQVGAILALVLALSACKTAAPDGGNVLADDGVVPPPTPAFLDICKKYLTTPESETHLVFAAVLLGAHDNASVNDLVQTVPCPELWKHIASKGDLELWPGKDLAPVAMFKGLAFKRISVSFKAFPAHFEALGQFPTEAFEAEPAAMPGFTGLDSTARATLMKVITSYGPKLKRLRLTKLGLSDLSGLAGMTGLEEIDFSENGVSDIAFLKDLDALRRIIAFSNTIQDVTPLGGLLSLEYLELEDNDVTSLDPLLNCANLESLYFKGNVKADSIFALQYLANLKELDVSDLPINTVEPLTKLPLRLLSLDNTKVTSLEPLRKSPIQELYLSGTKVKDLSPVTDMPELRKLNASKTLVTKLPPKLKATKLAIADFNETEITDYCPVLTVPTMKVLRLKNGTNMNQNKIQTAGFSCPQN